VTLREGSNESIVWYATETMLRRLPFSSAADHGGWRYEHFMWAFQLDAGRAKHAKAISIL